MTILQDYFKQQLVEFGFLSDLEIHYSLFTIHYSYNVSKPTAFRARYKILSEEK